MATSRRHDANDEDEFSLCRASFNILMMSGSGELVLSFPPSWSRLEPSLLSLSFSLSPRTDLYDDDVVVVQDQIPLALNLVVKNKNRSHYRCRFCWSSRTSPDDDVIDVTTFADNTSFSALFDVFVEYNLSWFSS